MFTRVQNLLCSLGALLLCAIAVPAFAHDATLDVVFEDYPPYEYVEDEEVKGVNMDIIREAFRRMDVHPAFEPRPWRRAILQLKKGEILALSSGFKTPEREEFAWFPSEPLAVEVNVIAVLDSSPLVVNNLDDLKGRSIGVVRSYLYGEPFDSLRTFQRVETKSMYQLVDMLLNNRMDAIVGNRAVIRHIVRKSGDLDRIKFIYEIGRDSLYLFFSKARGEDTEKLARDFGDTVREMRLDGTFEAIQSKY